MFGESYERHMRQRVRHLLEVGQGRQCLLLDEREVRTQTDVQHQSDVQQMTRVICVRTKYNGLGT